MDTMAQDLQKPEEPPRLEEGESLSHKKFIWSPLKMCTLDKILYIILIQNMTTSNKQKGLILVGTS